MRVVSQYVANKNNVGPKAKIDIEKILKQNYNAQIYTNKVNDFKPNFFSKIKKLFFSRNALKTNDFVIIQIPFSNKTEVLKCLIITCPLYPFRLGKNPNRIRNMTDEQRQAASERMRKAWEKRRKNKEEKE